MQREDIERLVGVICHNDCYIKSVAAALIAHCPYEEVFELVPKYTSERWETICRLHEMVVAWKPDQAHYWLHIARKPLLSTDFNHAGDYVQGSMLGFLKAAAWLDTRWPDPVEYNVQLPWTLASILCGPAKLAVSLEYLQKNGYTRQLAEAIKAYFFPATENIRSVRAIAVRDMVAYIRQHGEDRNFSCLDEFIIDRLCHGLLGNRPTSQKIAGIDYLLIHFGRAPTLQPEAT